MAKLNINGKVREVQAEPGTPLLQLTGRIIAMRAAKVGPGSRLESSDLANQ